MRTDAELVQQTLDGQTSAFDVLVRRWSARILAYVAARVRHAHSAEELTQESFLRAFRSLGGLQNPDKFGAWLLSIAHRQILDWQKAKSRTEIKLPDIENVNQSRIAPGSRLTENASDLDERKELLLTEIERLPVKLKEVLMIYYYDNVTYRDLAKMFGVSVASINLRLSQARELLRERLTAMESQP